ncbi:hypothetical protein BABINDRAFT_110730 [Babjeviella inositovora NRRL Y-12698]|uniref:MHF histone-fold complex subunit 1 n=1 Tax=Babjeviella inositovora NRRL Y-12698 TaxID=984486 RepID=A0A1E3QVN3_9ASCO|nr:uncharacterized protein BABINDRAFT_110730 [Babjeviella inositovora NRRL Y-12698]ODQ81719.1 hypothetical protein BABINDRAFT_110730 [Babjeviella inositovora NRRL Y-12698]
MKEVDDENNNVASQIKASIYLTVSKLIDEELKATDPALTSTPRFIASLVELVYLQAITLGEDLESFAQHGGRKIINPSDLYMVTRRNDALTDFLRQCESEMTKE